jgi:hypothetical protein
MKQAAILLRAVVALFPAVFPFQATAADGMAFVQNGRRRARCAASKCREIASDDS